MNGKLLKTKDKNTKRDIRRELRTLAKEERKRQQLAVADVIKNSDVVLTTLTGASSRKLENITFDLVIIDEAAQALEVACWIALLKVLLLFIYLFSSRMMLFMFEAVLNVIYCLGYLRSKSSEVQCNVFSFFVCSHTK